MAPPRLVDRDAPAVVTNTATVPQRASRLPRSLRFPILVALNFFISSTAWTAATSFIGAELGEVTKRDDDPTHVLARVGYRVFVLWFAWAANYDWIDIGALTTLATTPYAYILVTYYGVSTYTVAAYVNIEVLAIAFPTLLLRPKSYAHRPNASLRNRFLLESTQVQTTAALLSIGVYVTVIWIAIQAGVLNEFLIWHFDITTLAAAHVETALSLIVKVATAGIAARAFLVNPSISAQTASGTVTPVQPFDPATADLNDTLKHNFWFFSKRTRTLLRQTGALTLFLFVYTAPKLYTLHGADVIGALGYTGFWAFMNWIIAAWWVWAGDTSTDV